ATHLRQRRAVCTCDTHPSAHSSCLCVAVECNRAAFQPRGWSGVKRDDQWLDAVAAGTDQRGVPGCRSRFSARARRRAGTGGGRGGNAESGRCRMSWLTPEIIDLLIKIVQALVILFGTVFVVANLIWAERRLLALWQDRHG